MSDRGGDYATAVSGRVVARPVSGGAHRGGVVWARVRVSCPWSLVGPGEPRAFAAGPVVPPAPSPDLFSGQPLIFLAQPPDHSPPQIVAEIGEAAAACGVAVVVGPTPEDWVEHLDQLI